MTSVIIPAHDEAPVIERALAALRCGADADEVEIVVVCNGCSDDTAERARRFPQVRVLETPVASKSHALNLGDGVASRYPRVYHDADVVLDPAGVQRLARALAEPGIELAAPAVRLELLGSPWLVRRYLSVWARLPAVTEAVTGAGVLALSEAGRARFDRFPDVIADDRFLHDLFTPSERCVIDSVTCRVEAPRSLDALLRRRTRVIAGNQQLAHVSRVAPRRTSVSDIWCLVRRDPRRSWELVPFLAVTAAARARAAGRPPSKVAWGQDRSTRVSESRTR